MNMTDQINKDLVIAVMDKRQKELEKVIKLQADQLKSCQEYIEACKVLFIKYEQEAAANIEKMSQFAKVLDAREEESTRLAEELQRLKQYVQQLEQKAQES